MILSTTPSLEGKKVAKYLGLVSGHAILGANIFRDFSRRFAISSEADRGGMKPNYARLQTLRLVKYKSRLSIWGPCHHRHRSRL